MNILSKRLERIAREIVARDATLVVSDKERENVMNHIGEIVTFIYTAANDPDLKDSGLTEWEDVQKLKRLIQG